MLSFVACNAELALRHHHHRHHQHQEKAVQKQTPEADNGWEPMSAEQIVEMKAAEPDDPFQAKPQYGMYDMRGNQFEILDTPEKMDPAYQAKQHLNAVNAMNHLRGSADDDDDDDDE